MARIHFQEVMVVRYNRNLEDEQAYTGLASYTSVVRHRPISVRPGRGPRDHSIKGYRDMYR